MRLPACLLALLLIPAAIAAPAATDTTLFLTGEQGNISQLGLQNVLFMDTQLAGTDSQTEFSSASNPIGQGANPVRTVSWYWPSLYPVDTRILDDVDAVLFLQANAQVDITVRAELREVNENGGRTLGERTTRLGASDSGAVRLTIPANGQTVQADAALEFRLTVEGNSLATVLQYDSAQNPSRIEGLRTQPLDTDEDGLPDSLERELGTDPFDATDPGDGAFDSDVDGISDDIEEEIGTDPFRGDTDGDGWDDGAEYRLGTDPLDAQNFPDDDDVDGLANQLEVRWGLNPNRADSDGNGINDCDEDVDGDGLRNCTEQSFGTDALNADTDGDGISDFDEVQAGTDPTKHGRPPTPPTPDIVEPIAGGLMGAAALSLALVGLLRRHRL